MRRRVPWTRRLASTHSPGGRRGRHEHKSGGGDPNLDGSDRRLVSACEGRGVTDPEPSPDGKMLAFTCYSRSGGALFVSRIDASALPSFRPRGMTWGSVCPCTP